METGDPHSLIHQALATEAVESAEFAVCVYDDQGRYVAVNDCACKLLGYSREELLHHDVGDFTNGLDRGVLSRSDRREGVRMVHRKDGTAIPVAFVVAPTRVSKLPYFVSVWWPLAEDDPRASAAS